MPKRGKGHRSRVKTAPRDIPPSRGPLRPSAVHPRPRRILPVGYEAEDIWVPALTLLVSCLTHLFLMDYFERYSPLRDEKYGVKGQDNASYAVALSIAIFSQKNRHLNPFLQKSVIGTAIFQTIMTVLFQWFFFTFFFYPVLAYAHLIYERLFAAYGHIEHPLVKVALDLLEPHNFRRLHGFSILGYVHYKHFKRVV